VSRLGNLLRSWLHAAERLFQALVGLLFLFFTLAGASVTYTEWKLVQRAPSTGTVRLSLLIAFTVLLFFCALYSFLKARSMK
jgi:ABC-type antimicrobial peptide transport system permease subunit